jgi:hypothetical protein
MRQKTRVLSVRVPVEMADLTEYAADECDMTGVGQFLYRALCMELKSFKGDSVKDAAWWSPWPHMDSVAPGQPDQPPQKDASLTFL